MASFQHRLLKLSSHGLKHWVSLAPEHIPQLRKRLHLAARRLRPPKGLRVKADKLKHLPLQWLHPVGADADRVILFLHGGGFAVGSIQTHRGLAGRLAQLANMPCLIIDYRKAPEHPFPAALEDALSAYKYLLAKGYAPHQIVIAGDSAGGGLALSAQLAMKEMNLPLPAACVCLSPWVDLKFKGKSATTFLAKDPVVRVPEVRTWAYLYAGTHKLSHPLVSPLYADLSGLPPIFIQVSDQEVLTDDGIRLAQAIEAAGGQVSLEIWGEMMHVWQLFWRWVPEADRALRQAAAFIRTQAQLEASLQSQSTPHKQAS